MTDFSRCDSAKDTFAEMTRLCDEHEAEPGEHKIGHAFCECNLTLICVCGPCDRVVSVVSKIPLFCEHGISALNSKRASDLSIPGGPRRLRVVK